MLQQTRMEVVLGGYYDRFLERFPDVATLARASEDDVMALWSGLGYYRRARMLRAGAIGVVERFGGRIPATIDELLTLPGIGRYTAGAIASIAHRQRAPIVDGNVARIVARIDGIETPLGSPALMRVAWQRAEELVDACKKPRSFNQGLMEVGALICRPARPLCMLCPLQRCCVAFATGRMDELPVAKAKKATRELLIPLYLILDGDGRILMRRESGKLMSSMFHLPHGNSSLLGGTPLAAASPSLLGTFRHTVTTRRIEFALYQAELPGLLRDDDAYAWIDPRQLDDYPHPSYVRKALRLAKSKSAL
jgi:A/G-specific adenine glycosylase